MNMNNDEKLVNEIYVKDDAATIKKDFAKYVTLNMLSQMAFSCYTVADTFFVANSLAADGLTALNLAFPMFCFISGLGLMIGMGGSTKYSINKSKGNIFLANKMFTKSIYLMVVLSTLLVLAGCFFSGEIVRILGANDEIFDLTNIYLKVMMIFAPAFLTNHVLLCFVRNDGRPDLSMKAMITSSFSNILLDYIFMVRLGMGIFGAILATGLAPIISIIIMTPFLLSNKRNFRFIIGNKIDIDSATNPTHNPMIEKKNEGIIGIISCGVSFFLTESTSGIVMFLFNYIILGINGNLGVAAFSIVTVISLVVIALYTGISQGIQPLFSRYYGVSSTAGLRGVLNYALITMCVMSIIIYFIVYIAAEPIALLFNSERDIMLQEMAVMGLKIYFLACPFIGFNIVMATYFTTTGKDMYAQIITILRGFLFLIPIAFSLSSAFKMTGVWFSYPVSELTTAFIGIILLFISKKGILTKNIS